MKSYDSSKETESSISSIEPGEARSSTASSTNGRLLAEITETEMSASDDSQLSDTRSISSTPRWE